MKIDYAFRQTTDTTSTLNQFYQGSFKQSKTINNSFLSDRNSFEIIVI
jgi:hypothetical protein